jgi:hypothetical protein
MVLEPGKAEGDATDRHRGAAQWLFVVAGSGVATINSRRHPLRAGTLVLIPRSRAGAVDGLFFGASPPQSLAWRSRLATFPIRIKGSR